jgi:serine phosphatase RsbU (regulator of sigma subunit)/anti-sigma regulatory factor (Ser/Thr protein kinase)
MSQLTSNAVPVTFRISIACDLSQVSSARLAVRTFLREQHVRADELSACELALAEACNNAIQNVSAEGRNRPIEIRVLCISSEIEIHIIDHTGGFIWPDKAQLPNLENEHGRGVFFIQSFMDHANYFRGDGENTLVMWKLRSPRPQSNTSALPSSLAETQQALSEMARELCFRSETLAAIFRCSADLGRSNDVKVFAETLLNDLLHIAAAEWFVVRIIGDCKEELRPFVASIECAHLDVVNFGSDSVEAKAAETSSDIEFSSEQQPLAKADPLAEHFPGSSGFVHPIRLDQNLIGTLAIGGKSALPVAQREVIRTFADFLAIQLVNARLREQQLSSRLVSHELDIARGIQRSLLPKACPQLQGFGIAGQCESARQIGGDFYDLLQLSDTSVLMVIADVMGKGVPAALFAALLRSLIRANIERSSRPAEVLARINGLLFDDLSAVNMFITAQLVLLDSGQQRAIIGNAGHCPLLVGSKRSHRVQVVAPEGMPLGIMREAAFDEATISLEPDCRLLLYTDGVTDSRNPAGTAFSQERLQSWLAHAAQSLETAEALKEDLVATLDRFASPSPLRDDRTFLVVSKKKSLLRSRGPKIKQSRPPSEEPSTL